MAMPFPDVDATFTLDVRRSIILGTYLQHWGMCSYRIVAQVRQRRVETYLFPQSEQRVARLATMGLSGQNADENTPGCELLLVLPQDLAGATFELACAVLLDFAVRAMDERWVLRDGAAFSLSSVTPWGQAAVLLLDAPEDVTPLHVGAQHVDVLWVVPVFEDEQHWIAEHGVESFLERDEASEWSLADPLRPSVLGS